MSHRIDGRSNSGEANTKRRWLWLAAALVAVALIAALIPMVVGRLNLTAAPAPSGPPPKPSSGLQHVFVINLENKGYNRVFSPTSGAPYLAQTLRNQGVLLTQYYAIAGASLPNYVAQISGQSPNPRTIKDCAVYHSWSGKGTVPPDQAVGNGCVYPAQVTTIADQLTAAGKTWKGYMEDMKTPCRHPAIGKADDSKKAKVGDQYVTRHNPFVYFSSITTSAACKANVVDYTEMADDLKSISTTPNLSYITPNLCNDGHDKPCINGRSGGLRAINTWLTQEVPKILASPAYKADGVLIITFDESDEQGSKDSDADTGTPATGPAPTLPGGIAGGLVGAVVLSPHIKGGTTSNTLYNHYSLLGSMEDVFSLPYLGYAGAFGQNRFGFDVYTGKPQMGSSQPSGTTPRSIPATPSAPASKVVPSAPASKAAPASAQPSAAKSSPAATTPVTAASSKPSPSRP